MLRSQFLRTLNKSIPRSSPQRLLTRNFATGTKHTGSHQNSSKTAATEQGTGANNQGAGVGTGTNQQTQTYENSSVKGQPANPSASKGQHATKHSQTTPVTNQQKPLPTAGSPDAVGASPQGSPQSINAETKPVHHNNKHASAGTHTPTSNTSSNAKHANASHSHQSHSTHNVSHSQHSDTSHNASNTQNVSTTGTMDLANASATAKSKAQEIKNKVQSMVHEAGREIPEGNSFVVMGSAVLATVLFMMMNPDRRYLKRVYKVNEKPRIEALQHPTTH